MHTEKTIGCDVFVLTIGVRPLIYMDVPGSETVTTKEDVLHGLEIQRVSIRIGTSQQEKLNYVVLNYDPSCDQSPEVLMARFYSTLSPKMVFVVEAGLGREPDGADVRLPCSLYLHSTMGGAVVPPPLFSRVLQPAVLHAFEGRDRGLFQSRYAEQIAHFLGIRDEVVSNRRDWADSITECDAIYGTEVQSLSDLVGFPRTATAVFAKHSYAIADTLSRAGANFSIIHPITEVMQADGTVMDCPGKWLAAFITRCLLIQTAEKYVRSTSNTNVLISNPPASGSESLALDRLGIILREKLIRDTVAQQQAQLERGAERNRQQADLLRSRSRPHIVETRLFNADMMSLAPPSDFASDEPVTVNCAAIYPAVVAALKRLKATRFKNMSISANHINSIEIVEMLNRGTYFDFVVAAEDPLFLIGGAGASEYYVVSTLLASQQKLFRRKLSPGSPQRRHDTVLVVPGSSGVTQARGRRSRGIDENLVDINLDDIYSRALSLAPNEAIAVWDPMISRLAEDPDFEELPDGQYPIHVSLFAHKSWVLSETKKPALLNFVACFLQCWRKTVQGDVTELTQSLLADEQFLKSFTRGSGI